MTVYESLKEVQFVVPGEPQGKGRARIGTVAGRIRMFTPAKTVSYEGLIALAAQEAMQGRPLFEGPMMLQVTAYFPIRNSWSKKKQAAARENSIIPDCLPDSDNIVKAVCDGMNKVVWKDDRQVAELHMRKMYSDTPRVEVWTVPL